MSFVPKLPKKKSQKWNFDWQCFVRQYFCYHKLIFRVTLLSILFHSFWHLHIRTSCVHTMKMSTSVMIHSHKLTTATVAHAISSDHIFFCVYSFFFFFWNPTFIAAVSCSANLRLFALFCQLCVIESDHLDQDLSDRCFVRRFIR